MNTDELRKQIENVRTYDANGAGDVHELPLGSKVGLVAVDKVMSLIDAHTKLALLDELLRVRAEFDNGLSDDALHTIAYRVLTNVTGRIAELQSQETKEAAN